MICRYCQANLETPIRRSWTVVLPGYGIPSQNQLKGNGGSRRSMHAYRLKRDSAVVMLRRYADHVADADELSIRRVIVTRLYGGRMRPYDIGNLCGGAKPLIDAMVLSQLIYDDDPGHCAIWYRQERNAAHGTTLRIEEI